MIHQVDETRGRIISAAKKIFTEEGFFTPQMKDIAAEVSISRSSLYRYFADKSDLALAIFEEVFSEIIGRIRPGVEKIIMQKDLSGLEKLRHYLSISWASNAADQEFRFIAEFDAFFSGNRVPENFKNRLIEVLQTKDDEIFLAVLREGVADGSIRDDIDVHLTMVTILNTIRGLRQRLILRGDTLIELHNNERDALLPQLLDFLIDGLASK